MARSLHAASACILLLHLRTASARKGPMNFAPDHLANLPAAPSSDARAHQHTLPPAAPPGRDQRRCRFSLLAGLDGAGHEIVAGMFPDRGAAFVVPHASQGVAWHQQGDGRPELNATRLRARLDSTCVRPRAHMHTCTTTHGGGRRVLT